MIKLILIGLTALSLTACKKEIITEPAPADTRRIFVKTEGPTTASINQVVQLTVSWTYYGGCDTWSRFEQAAEPGGLVLKGYAIMFPNPNMVCTMEVGTRTTTYKFTATTAGLQKLRFINEDGTEVVHSILVN